MIAQNRDNNEPEIIDGLKKAGAWVIQMDKDAGFDLVVIYDRPHIVEVKNPEQLTKKGDEAMLTDNERDTKDRVERAGGKYNIILTIEQALEMIGIDYV